MRTSTARWMSCLTALALLLGGAGQAEAGYVDAVLADNPMLYWRLGDADKSAGATASNSAFTGSLANGVYQGAVGNVTDTALLGDTDSAAHFGVTTAGGSNGDQVILNPVPAIPATAFSAEMWIRASLPAPSQQAVISYNATGTGGENNMLLFKNSGDFHAYIDGPNKATGLPAAGLFDGEWNHLAFTWRSSDGQMNTYLNGNLAASTTHQAGAVLNPGGALVLTQEQDGIAGGYDNSQKFVGDLDEVAIYDTVLTPTQISQHFAANHPLGIPNLQVQLHANDIAGSPGDAVTTWADQSGHRFDATTDGGAATLQTALVNGTPHNVVRFDGDDGLATASYVPTRGDYTLFVVGSAAATDTRGTFLAQDAGGWNNLDTGFGVGQQNTFTTGVVNGGPTLETHGPTTGTSNGVAGGASLADGKLRLFTARVEGTDYDIRVNGFGRTATSTEAGIFGANGSEPMQIGQMQGRFLEGDIADVLVFDRALTQDEFQRVSDMLTAKYHLPTALGVAAANISVPATTSNAASTWAVQQSTQRTVGIGSPPNVGDVEIAVEGFELKPADGILLATVREHERDNGDGVHRGTVEVGKGSFGGGVDYLTLSTTEAGYGGIREHNADVGVAFFPFAEGWQGAHLNPAGTILYANGIDASMITTAAGTGRHQLSIPGVSSVNDGMLFTVGGSNEDNVVPTGVIAGGSGWDIRVQDNAADFNATGEADNFSLLYVPYNARYLVGGRYDGLSNTVLQSKGDFTLTRDSTGVFRLSVAGRTPQDGMLLLTPSYEVTSGGITAPDDNMLTYEASGNDFIIHSYDLPGASTLQNTQFAFAYVDFDNPIRPPGPVGFWAMDKEVAPGGTVVNSAAPGRGDGTLVGNAYTGSGMLHLDGSGDRVEIADHPIFDNFEGGNEVTIAAWIKPDIGSLSDRPTILSTRIDNDPGSFQLEAGAAGHGSNRLGVTTPGVWNAETQNDALAEGEWSHVAYVKDGTTQKLYVNGVEQTVAWSDPRTFQNNTALKLIGAGTGLSSALDFKGLMKNVAIHEEALPASQLVSPFSLPGGPYAQAVLADNPIQYWRLNETSGTKAVNIGSSIDGTYNGPTQGLAGPQPSIFPGLEPDNAAPGFDGASDRVQSNSALPTMTQWTLEAWAKPEALGHSKTILSNDRGGWNDDVLFGLAPETSSMSPSNRWAIIHQDDNTQTRTIVSAPADAAQGQWAHVVATSDGSQLSLYVNGRLAGSQAMQGNDLNLAGAATWIGASPNGIIRFFDGTLDEVAVYNRALSAAEVLGHFDTAAGYSTANAVVAANIAVTGTGGGTQWSVEQSSAVGLGVFPTNNEADIQISAASTPLHYTQGVLMATVRENDRNGAKGTVEVAFPSGFGGSDTLSIATARAGTGQGGELNINVAAAWFPFSGAWTGGHVNSAGTLVAGQGVSQSMLTPFPAGGAGAYELRLPGVAPATHGMLFTIGGSNEDNITTTQLLADGTGWLVNVQDANLNISSEADDFSFLFMPYSTINLIGGRVDNDAAGTLLNSVGDFSLVKLAGETSIFRLSIPGETPDTGMLLLTILDNPGAQYTLPDDNIISYGADGDDFIIQILDLDGLADEAVGAGFVFAFVDFDNPPLLPEPATLTILALGGLAILVRRRRSR